jgi:hypothetical protein
MKLKTTPQSAPLQTAVTHIQHTSNSAHSPVTQPQTNTTVSQYYKSLSAGALRLCHTIYWNFKRSAFLTALHCIEKLVMYGMPHLAFYVVWWATDSSHTTQCVIAFVQRKSKYKTQKMISYTPKILYSFIIIITTKLSFWDIISTMKLITH